MIHQGLVARGVRLLIRMVVDRRGQTIRAMPLGHAAELPERFLNPRAQGLERFGKTQRNRLHVRVRQHAMKQRVIKAMPGDRDPQIIHHREVAGRQSPRMMHLLEYHGFSRSLEAAPFGHPSLESSPGGIGKLPRVFLLEPFQQRLGLEAGFGFQPRLNLVPNLLERIDARAVLPRRFAL